MYMYVVKWLQVNIPNVPCEILFNSQMYIRMCLYLRYCRASFLRAINFMKRAKALFRGNYFQGPTFSAWTTTYINMIHQLACAIGCYIYNHGWWKWSAQQRQINPYTVCCNNCRQWHKVRQRTLQVRQCE